MYQKPMIPINEAFYGLSERKIAKSVEKKKELLKNKNSKTQNDAVITITEIGKIIDSYRRETERMMNSEKSFEAANSIKKIKGLI